MASRVFTSVATLTFVLLYLGLAHGQTGGNTAVYNQTTNAATPNSSPAYIDASAIYYYENSLNQTIDFCSGGILEIGRAGNILRRRGGRGDFQEAGRTIRTEDRLPADGRWMPDGFGFDEGVRNSGLPQMLWCLPCVRPPSPMTLTACRSGWRPTPCRGAGAVQGRWV